MTDPALAALLRRIHDDIEFAHMRETGREAMTPTERADLEAAHPAMADLARKAAAWNDREARLTKALRRLFSDLPVITAQGMLTQREAAEAIAAALAAASPEEQGDG